MLNRRLWVLLLVSCVILLSGCIASGEGTQYYTIHYEVGEADSNVGDQVKLPGESVIITSRDVWRDRYVFLGWATTPNATEPEYVGGDVYTADANLTLYAVWREPIEINVTGSGGTWTIDYPNNVREAWIKIRVADTGYYYLRSMNEYYDGFEGMFYLMEEDNDTYETIADGVAIEKETSFGLWPVDYGVSAVLEKGKDYWVRYTQMSKAIEISISTNVYHIQYNENGGNEKIGDQVKLSGESIMITSRDVWRDRYVFLGWATTPNAAEPEYVGGDTYEEDANLTLYAVWREPIEINVTSVEKTWTIEYPKNVREAWVKMCVAETGNYYMRSINEYYVAFEGMFYMIEGNDTYETIADGVAIENETDFGLCPVDYGISVVLETGKEYWLRYDQMSDPMTLKITSQTKPVIYQADITLPSNLEHIEEGAFEGAGFESVKIPAGVYYVGPRAFANCTNLETLIVYAKKTYFDSTAFDGCNSITVIAANDSKAHDLAVKKGWTFVEMN